MKSGGLAVLLLGAHVSAFAMRLPGAMRGGPRGARRPSRSSGTRLGAVEEETGFESVMRGGASPRSGAPLAPLVAGALSAFGAAQAALAAETRWAASEFLDELKAAHVERASFSADSSGLTVVDVDGGRHSVALLESQVGDVVAALRSAHVPFDVAAAAQDGAGLAATIANVIVPVALLGGLFLLLRGGGPGGGGGFGGGDGPMGMLQSRAKVEVEPETGVTFADVAGCDASKLELEEVVEFLKQPERFEAVGAICPRGVILEGPPGTGKTLLARAVAGEAKVPFISTSGSEFVEMFVGVGASRIRSMFGDAKKNAPCIIFIDEIDAIGRQRASGGGMAGSNDEREQTLNQILTEMDGFSGNSGVIVIAATNRADILDNALLRPGRFDRRVPVDLADKAGRAEILKVHCRDKPLAPEVDIDTVAGRTIGFSGAMLQNLMNEAAIYAVRNDRDVIAMDDVESALDRLTVGQSKKTGTQLKERNSLVAYHEAGHALMAALTPGYDAVAKVTIVPRSNGAGGFTLFTPSEERSESGMYPQSFLKAQLAVALGGRVAEILAVGEEDVTTGASNDLQQVKSLSRRMIAQWGFTADPRSSDAYDGSPLRAPIAWEGANGRDDTAPAKATERLLDLEQKKIVQEAYDLCYKTLSDNKAAMDAIVEALLDKETIDNTELTKIINDNGAKVAA